MTESYHNSEVHRLLAKILFGDTTDPQYETYVKKLKEIYYLIDNRCVELVIHCEHCAYYDPSDKDGGWCNGFGDGQYTPSNGYCHNAGPKEVNKND